MDTDITRNNSVPNAFSPRADRTVQFASTCVDMAVAVLTWSALPAVAFVALSLSRGSFSSTQLGAAVLIAFARASIDYLNMNPGERDAVHKAHCVDVAPSLAQSEDLPDTAAPALAFGMEAGT